VPRGRPKRYCKCGCQERLDLIEPYRKQRRYVSVAHRDEAARRRPYTPPLRRHRMNISVDVLTQATRLVGVSIHVGDLQPIAPENISTVQG
jgi:hypothetical protein